MNSEAFESYQNYLEKQPVSIHTRRNYLQRVKNYLTWLADVPDGDLALSDPIERDFHMREFKASLLQHGARPSSVNAILSAVDNFYLSRGMDPARVKRLELPRLAPRALQPDEEKRLMKAVMRVSLRNRALIMLLWHTGLRISEAASLNVGDLTLTARTGQVVVRCGKGLKQRTISLNADLREVLLAYTAKQVNRTDHEPLFLSQKRSRLSVASIDRIIRQLGKTCGLDLSAHDFRAFFIGRLVRLGTDIAMVAELAGHGRIETVRRYSLPTEEDKQAALEKLCNAG